jgi:hypothetical protein
MIKLYTLSFLFLLIFIKANSQTLKENKVDEFTKNSVKRTSWEPVSKMGKIYAHVRASKINDQYYLDVKTILLAGDVFGIKEGDVVMLKMSTDSILTLNNPKHLVSCKGCGSVNIIGSDGYGVELNLPVLPDQVDYLISNKITKIRIYTTDGFVESDIKEKFQDAASRVLKLIK